MLALGAQHRCLPGVEARVEPELALFVVAVAVVRGGDHGDVREEPARVHRAQREAEERRLEADVLSVERGPGAADAMLEEPPEGLAGAEEEASVGGKEGHAALHDGRVRLTSEALEGNREAPR